MFSIEEIGEIIKLVEQSSLQRFELEQKAVKLVLVKSKIFSLKSESGLAESCANAVIKSSGSLPVPEITPTALADKGFYKILAPVVGSFYAAPEPGAEPFVKVAQKVAAGTVVGIVEVMKLFNEIESEIDGEIVDILVKDGDFVEYGQPLFIVKPE